MQLTFQFPKSGKDTFENMVVDPKNQDTARLCEAFAEERPGQPGSIVLCGPEGAGKTHLLSAIGDRINRKHGEGTAVYLDCGLLNRKVHSAATYEELKTYLAEYENALFLALDDLDKVAGDEEAEDQVFHLYNAVIYRGGRFAAALRTPPALWKFASQLSTRLLWGQALTVNPVGDEGRERVLIKIAGDKGLTLPEKVAAWLVHHLPRDPATLAAALNDIDRYSLTTGRKVSIQLAREALGIKDGI